MLRAFGCPVFPEMAYSKDKAECAELFKEPEIANKIATFSNVGILKLLPTG